MRTSTSDAAKLRALIDREAAAAGFDAVAVTRPDAIPLAPARLAEFVAAGFHGSMGWIAETLQRRSDPSVLWPDVRSVVVLAMNYGPDEDPRALLSRRDRGAVSVYARNRDYHDVMKGRLKEIAGKLVSRAGGDVKVFVDTAPVMEKPLAAAAGLGWQGKHTNLVSRAHGSWLFLGSIFTTAELVPDTPEADHCGTCTACLDACPTNAFPAPYRLDARRCISYLTIENKGPIPSEFRAAILTMEMKSVVTKLGHQLRHVARVGARIVTFLGRRFVRIAKSTQIRRDDAEMRRQQRNEAIPVEMRLRRAMQQQQRLPLAGRHIMHANAVHPRPTMANRHALMIVDLDHAILPNEH